MKHFAKLTAAIIAATIAGAFTGPAFAQADPLKKSGYITKQNTKAPPGVKPTPGAAAKSNAQPRNKYTTTQSKRAPKGQKPTASGAAKVKAMPKNEYTKAQDAGSKMAR